MSERVKHDERCEELFQFFAAYFNEFWEKTNKLHKSLSDRGVITYFAETNPPNRLRDLQDKLRAFLAEPLDDKVLTDVLAHDFGCAYTPEPDGLTDRQWLHKLDEYIGKEISKTND